MRIVEFTEKDNTDLPFNVVEDTIVFMRNDPHFYRRHYYPTMCKMGDQVRAGSKINPTTILGPMIEMGCNKYNKKYNLGRSSEEIFNDDSRKELMQRIYSEELEAIKKGEYK